MNASVLDIVPSHIPLRGEMIPNVSDGASQFYEPVFNSGCITAATDSLRENASDIAYSMLRDSGVSGVNFVTSDIQRLPESNRESLIRSGEHHFGKNFHLIHPTISTTQNAFKLRVLQSALGDGFERHLEDHPDYVTIASITHSDPANAREIVDRVLRSNPENIAARSALTLALNDKVTPTRMFPEQTGYQGTYDSLDSLVEAVNQVPEGFLVAKAIGHAAGGTNVIFLTSENIRKEKTLQALREIFGSGSSLLLFKYLTGFELSRSDGLIHPSAQLRPIFVGEKLVGSVLKFSGSAVPADLFENPAYRSKSPADLNKILNGSSGLGTSAFYDDNGNLIYLSRAERTPDDKTVQKQYDADQAAGLLEGIYFPNGSPIVHAASAHEHALSCRNLQTIICGRMGETMKNYQPTP